MWSRSGWHNLACLCNACPWLNNHPDWYQVEQRLLWWYQVGNHNERIWRSLLQDSALENLLASSILWSQEQTLTSQLYHSHQTRALYKKITSLLIGYHAVAEINPYHIIYFISDFFCHLRCPSGLLALSGSWVMSLLFLVCPKSCAFADSKGLAHFQGYFQLESGMMLS